MTKITADLPSAAHTVQTGISERDFYYNITKQKRKSRENWKRCQIPLTDSQVFGIVMMSMRVECIVIILLSFLLQFLLKGGLPLKNVKELLADAPVIAAVKDDSDLERALESECRVVFLLYGNILNIKDLVERVHQHDKLCIVHIDLIEGLSNRDIAVDGLVKLSCPDGIISTRSSLIRRAQQLGLLSIQRAFLLDSMSMRSLLSQVEATRPDFIEILPGVIHSAIAEVVLKSNIPVIAGGLIRNKQDVIQALRAGVIAVSTSSQEVWEM